MENRTLGCGTLNVRKYEVCRLCMKTQEYYLSIFVSNAEFKTSIGKAIEDLLVLKVAKNDNLPEIVCCPCITKLMEFREFKEMCMNSAREFGRHAPVEPITCPVKDEFLPMQVLGEGTSGTWTNSVDGESQVPVAPNDLSLDPFALENQTDTKVVRPRDPLEESDHCGDEHLAETEFNEDAAVCRESKNILMGDQIEIKVGDDIKMDDCSLNIEMRREEGVLENEGSAKECSGVGAPVSETKPENQVDCLNYIGGIPVVPEIYLDKIATGRQEYSQHQVPSYSSCNDMRKKNLQFEYSTAIYPVSRCRSGKIAKRKENMKPTDLKNVSSLSNSLKQSKCDICGKNFRTSCDLKRHSVIHTGVKPHQCDVCGKMFTHKSHLKSHCNVHTGVKPFKCNVCGKKFAHKSDLKRHLVIHTGVKPYKCAVCRKSFNGQSSLKRHLVIHSGERSFECNVCGKNFNLKSSLKRHLVIHTGIKPFNCNVCGKNFNQKSNLNGHLVTHTGKKPFECNACGKMFPRISDLNTHAIVHTV